MPQTTPERRARWPGLDREAIAYLEARGWRLTSGFEWLAPCADYTTIEREDDAIVYLIEEWDFGGRVEPRVSNG